MDPLRQHQINITRRQFFGDVGLRFGGAAPAMLMADSALRGAAAPSAPTGAARVHPPLQGMPHFTPRAKSVIYLHMNGGPSQLDTWDYKPRLHEYFDKDLPPEI